MNFKMMGKFISQIIAIEAVFMIPALIIARKVTKEVDGLLQNH